MGLFGEVWQQLEGNRLAVYENENPEDGLLSIVAILDTDDAERLLAELANLTRFVRLSALPPDDPDSIASDEIQALVRQLGDSRFERRQSVLRRAGW